MRRLADIISAEGVLDTLVDPRQSSWFLYGTLRALTLFTSSEFGIHSSPAYVFGVTVNPIFLVTFLARVSHSGKELYKRFLSIPGTTPNPSQGGDLDVGADPDIEIFQENVKLPHLEGLCLHLGDHTRDNDDVNHVSIFNHRLPLHFCTCI